MTVSKTLQEIREIEIDCPGDVFVSRKSQEIRLSNPSPRSEAGNTKLVAR